MSQDRLTVGHHVSKFKLKCSFSLFVRMIDAVDNLETP